MSVVVLVLTVAALVGVPVGVVVAAVLQGRDHEVWDRAIRARAQQEQERSEHESERRAA